ncbi:MFS transporter [Pseudonocardia endophytica]|uniref:Sugar phosphate permease n=1 Tax=Pseudonocardia endophytica TaxID=401976 RepID=A0A4R1HKI3_PSEEN|nr:MFS transporter [Pseudonocardia endophytica]TCK21473.1 sugar phosphate permease [Pseudonocardia endophytica]
MSVEKSDRVPDPAVESGPPARPRGKNLRWAVIGAITVLTITNYLDRGNLSVAAPLIRDDLGFSNTEMGLILSAFIWPYAIMNLPAGWAVDRWGPRLIMTLAAGLWSIAGALTGAARGVGVFLGLRVVLGVAEAPLFPAALKATSEWFPEHEKARATSIYIAATQVGLAIAPPITTALMLAFGWELMFVLVGLLGFVGVVGWVVVYRRPEDHPRLSPEEREYIGVDRREPVAVAHRSVGRDWARLFRYPTVWAMMLGAFCLQYVFWFYITWLPSYLESAQNFSITAAGLISALPYIAGGVAVIIGGRFSDRLVKRGMLAMHARRRTIAGGALLTGLALVATAFSDGPVLAVVLLTLGMFTYSLTTASYWALAADVVTTDRMVGSMGSIQNFAGFLGGAFAPIATGVIVDRAGGFVPALIVAAVLLVVTTVMYGGFVNRRLPV